MSDLKRHQGEGCDSADSPTVRPTSECMPGPGIPPLQMCPVRWVCALVLHGCPGLGQAKKKAGKKLKCGAPSPTHTRTPPHTHPCVGSMACAWGLRVFKIATVYSGSILYPQSIRRCPVDGCSFACAKLPELREHTDEEHAPPIILEKCSVRPPAARSENH